jgi:hypothetical protein
LMARARPRVGRGVAIPSRSAYGCGAASALPPAAHVTPFGLL